MKISRRIRRSKWFKKFVAACLVSGMVNFGFVPLALALPQGGSVQWGNIDISNPAIIKMLTGNGAIINWDSFSIANGETLTFNFDLVGDAAVLNRVITNNPSLIAGLLEATNNGSVILVNPNGIVFGQGAQINTNNFLASTIDISNDSFKSFINGETNLLQFKSTEGVSKGIEFTGDTYTNMSNLAFIGSIISVAPGITISAGNASNPIKDYGYIRLLAGKEVDIKFQSGGYSVRNLTADASNTINIGDATGGATIQMEGINITGGAVTIDGSKNSRSSIYSGNNSFSTNSNSIMAISQMDGDNDTRSHTLDNTVNIKNTNLNAENDGGILEVIGGKTQITDSSITATGALDIVARSGREGDIKFAAADNSTTLENVKINSNGYNYTAIMGGKVQITDSSINTNGNVNIRARSKWQSDTDFAGADNSLTLKNVKIDSDYDATIRSGKVQITDSAINSNGVVDVMALSERYNPDGINTRTISGTDNSIILENVKLFGENSTKVRGGKLEITNSDINTNGTLNIWAYAKRETSATSDPSGNDSITTADPDNSITIKNTDLSGNYYNGRYTEIVGGKVQISDSTINSGDINIVSANSIETNGDFSNATYKANANNTLNINNSSIIGTSYSRIRSLGGAIDINESYIEGRGIGLAAFEELINDQRTWPHDTYFIGESSFKIGAGNSVTLSGNSSIVTSGSSTIKGFNIKVDQSSIATNGELGSSLSAVSSYVNSDSKRVQNYEADSKNIMEISNGSSITSTNDNGQIMLIGGVINNNGTVTANNGSAAAVALWELKGSGTLEGAGGVIDFSGKDMEAGDYDYTLHGQTVTITVEKDNPDKPQPIFETSWDADNNIKATIYLKSTLAPSDIDINTPNEDVIKVIDKVLETATPDEALKEIETIFANIHGKSEQDKAEIAQHLMNTAKQEGFDETDVAKAIIDGDSGSGTFDSNLSEATNETSKENNSQQQSGDPNVNGTTQLTQNNNQTASNNEISSGVSLEGEALDDN